MEWAQRVTAARLGLAWPHLGSAHSSLVAQLAAMQDVPLPGALTAMDPWDRPGMATTLGQIERLLERDDPASPGLLSLKAGLRRSTAAVAWHRGWKDAEALRAALGRASDRPLPFRDVVDDWGVGADRSAVSLERHASVVGWRAGGRPFRLSGPSNEFRETRDVWALCFGAGHDHSAVIGIGPRGSARPVANAFATELLAPIRAVRAAVGHASTLSEDEVDELASSLGAPTSCVRHQIENHRLATVG